MRSGWHTKLPNHEMIAFTNASMARKAIRLAAMLATSLIEAEAPAAAASRMLRSFLEKIIMAAELQEKTRF